MANIKKNFEDRKATMLTVGFRKATKDMLDKASIDQGRSKSDILTELIETYL